MVRTSSRDGSRCLRFPHTRGDGPKRIGSLLNLRQFSPHAWGWSGHLLLTEGGHRVFPTRVGMVRSSRILSASPARFPHTRGDGPPLRDTQVVVSPFSPQAWGWSNSPAHSHLRREVFPTRVGMVRDTAQ